MKECSAGAKPEVETKSGFMILKERGWSCPHVHLFTGNLTTYLHFSHRRWESRDGLWQKLIERIAYLILARIDPYLARRQL